MPLGGQSNATATTPGRVSHLILNPDNLPALKEGVLSFRRGGGEIARAGFGPNNSSNVMRYFDKCIGLKPIQLEPGKLAETATGTDRIIALTDFDLPSPGVAAQRKRFRQQPELMGVTYDASVQTSGDSFIKKIIAAGQSFAQSHAAHIGAHGQIPILPSHVPMNRLGVGKITYRAGQGYCWRFTVTGTKIDSRQMIGSFYFGGSVGEGGIGRYGLAVDGTGQAILFEQTSVDPVEFTDVYAFRYAPADRISGTTHQIVIKPYLAPSPTTVGYIDFTVHQSGEGRSLVQPYYRTQSPPQFALYVVKRKATPSSPARENITGAGNVWFDLPPDCRNENQFSRLGYPTTGYFYDYPFATPFNVSTSNDTVLSWGAVVPDGCTVEGSLYNPFTGLELTVLSSTATSKTYATPAGLSHLQFRGDFTSDGEDTGFLYSFTMTRNGLIQNLETEEIDVVDPNLLSGTSISGAESDPSQETIQVMVEDYTNELEGALTRGRLPYRYEQEYDATDPTKRSVLSGGILLKPERTRHRGKKKQGFSGGGPDRLFPHTKWSRYVAQGYGDFVRLKEKISFNLLDFLKDTDTPGLPAKVTYAVSKIINYCGYPFEMIDIPDSPIRLFTSETRSPNEAFTIEPGQELGDIAVKLLKDYLGWFLVRDFNAGVPGRGMWRAIAPSVPPYTNRAVFKTAQSSAGKLANHAGAYGNAAAGYWSESGSVTGFIASVDGQPTMTSYTKPPEANAVLVIGGGGEELANGGGNKIFMSWQVNRDGLNYFASHTPDTDPEINPDYIGELVPLLYVDHTLSTQAMVDFVARRLYHTTTHGIRMTRFMGPLLLITDPDDTQQTQPRPLRFYDPVQINDDGTTSQWLVRNVNPIIKRDRHSMAWYELEAPRAPYV